MEIISTNTIFYVTRAPFFYYNINLTMNTCLYTLQFYILYYIPTIYTYTLFLLSSGVGNIKQNKKKETEEKNCTIYCKFIMKRKSFCFIKTSINKSLFLVWVFLSCYPIYICISAYLY